MSCVDAVGLMSLETLSWSSGQEENVWVEDDVEQEQGEEAKEDKGRDVIAEAVGD